MRQLGCFRHSRRLAPDWWLSAACRDTRRERRYFICAFLAFVLLVLPIALSQLASHQSPVTNHHSHIHHVTYRSSVKYLFMWSFRSVTIVLLPPGLLASSNAK